MQYAVRNIYKQFNGLKVLEDVSIDFQENKVTCILGPSGCGKSTLLNIAASILKPDSGSIVGFDRKALSFIFQEDRLLEWRTVERNLDFVLKDRLGKAERLAVIERYLQVVGLYEFRTYYPGKLSGGMRQRVSIARAFACASQVLIMDEPFKSLDLNTKLELMKCFFDLMNADPRTVVLVTHDIDEAAILGDEIVILDGKPAKVRNVFKNSVSQEERWERGNKIDKLKAEIEELIFSAG